MSQAIANSAWPMMIDLSQIKRFARTALLTIVVVLLPTLPIASCGDDDSGGDYYGPDGKAPPSWETQKYNDYMDDQFKDSNMRVRNP